MASSLSAYWVRFFKGAGFPQDVATKHAVVFSNNRIKPDMLPDLDKPSLKEMGIALMGDMIAILRYAKKVVEETTCERFLVDSEDSSGTPKPIAKKTVTKAPAKTVASKVKSDTVAVKKIVKVPTSLVKKTVTVKKPVSTSGEIITELANQKKQTVLKRKLEEEDEFDSTNEDEWNGTVKKVKSMDNKDEKVGYTVILPKGSTTRGQQILKKSMEQKRTVFDRLGDSSVTSTTNLAETLPTFNITGLGKDVLKRSVSVFNRLGDKDAKKDNIAQAGILKNGTTTNTGILKIKSPSARTSVITTNKVISKSVGTMRADQEASRKVMSNNVTQLVKTTKKISFNNTSSSNAKMTKPGIASGKLASERLTSIPAKARLGTVKTSAAKQVTFDRVMTVAHVKKPDVFSRLGI
ncbi:uncharacterized protein LOC143370130 [Andrena cerasifolii]|uniref:uncharacterized protein LOC143370130 n=1 Tax=Andrena cerasifolii TaxID=2819439 RepID=UPI004038205C